MDEKKGVREQKQRNHTVENLLPFPEEGENGARKKKENGKWEGLGGTYLCAAS